MLPKLTLFLTFLAASATTYALFAMTENIGPLLPATGQLLFLIGPYAALAILAWVARSHQGVSLILCGFTLALFCVALYSYYVAYDQFVNRDPMIPEGSNWMPFLVAATQWLVALFLAVIGLPLIVYRKRREKSEGAT